MHDLDFQWCWHDLERAEGLVSGTRFGSSEGLLDQNHRTRAGNAMPAETLAETHTVAAAIVAAIAAAASARVSAVNNRLN